MKVYIFLHYIVCVCVCVFRHMCMDTQMPWWKTAYSCQESLIFLYYVGPRFRTQVLRLDNKPLDSLICMFNPAHTYNPKPLEAKTAGPLKIQEQSELYNEFRAILEDTVKKKV